MDDLRTVKGLALAFALGLLAWAAMLSAALAQQQPPFAPYTVTEQQHQQMLTFLGDVPAKFSNPIANALMQMEQVAQQAKTAADAKAAEDAKKKAEQEKKP